MEIKTEDYCVSHDPATAQVQCHGSFMLNGAEEYAPILSFFMSAAEQCEEGLTLDLRGLDFMNSSGINTMTKFVIYVRNKDKLKLTVIGQTASPWQARLVNNLRKLMPALDAQLQ